MELNSEPQPSISSQAENENDNPKNYGWTKVEKFELLQAIKEYGSKDIRVLGNVMRTKTPNEIKNALKYYKKKAFNQQSPKGENKKRSQRSDVNSMPTIPLACWAKILSDTFTFEELQTETATALRVIAECERIPPPMCTENINFRGIYKTLADAMEGKNIANNAAADIIEKCVTNTALLSKKFIRNSTLKSVLNGINLSEKDMNQFPTPTNDVELSTVRSLASQRNYNPFNIPEKYLKSTFDDVY